jgi:hypothetical protein
MYLGKAKTLAENHGFVTTVSYDTYPDRADRGFLQMYKVSSEYIYVLRDWLPDIEIRQRPLGTNNVFKPHEIQDLETVLMIARECWDVPE